MLLDRIIVAKHLLKASQNAKLLNHITSTPGYATRNLSYLSIKSPKNYPVSYSSVSKFSTISFIYVRSFSSTLADRKRASHGPKIKTTALPEQDPSRLSHSVLLREAISRKDAHLSWLVYTTEKRRGLSYIDYRDLANLLKAHVTASKDGNLINTLITQLEKILSDVRRSKLVYDVDVFNSLLVSYAQDEKYFSRLESLWEGMKRDNELSINTLTCCTIIDAYARYTNDIGRLKEQYKTMKEHTLDSVTYAKLISTYAALGRIEDTSELLNDLESSTITPEPHAYNALIQGYIQEHQDMASAMNVYRRMINKNIVPNTYTFTLLIRGYMDSHDITAALNLFQSEMIEKYNITVDIVTMNVIIGGYMKLATTAHAIGDINGTEENLNKARDWYLTLRGMGMNPTAVTFNTLIGGFGSCGKIDDVNLTVREMQNLHVMPTLITFHHLAQLYGELSNIDGIKLVWEDLTKLKIEPNERTFGIFIKSAIAAGSPSLATEFLKICENWAETNNKMYIFKRVLKYSRQVGTDNNRFLKSVNEVWQNDVHKNKQSG
ncbi:7791_t:CDS:1 [Paraglomus occultum]|uniref:7791_t:CDS:1 n=1 Tax=Paraglomus occultum TaxID=144539 RepID=A0A9N9AG05_9GLOM|nr:7791_t:CDS:1 [Paraglomus occultum]